MINTKAFATADIRAFRKQIELLAKVSKQPEQLQQAATTAARAGAAVLRAVGVDAPEHRPLGSVRRVRRAAYDDSARYRHEMNAVKRIEPRSIDELPD